MPSRLRYNNQGGTLGGAGLTASGTTITFTAAPGFATLQSGDHIPLILDPPQGATPSANFEIAWLTAYTAGATTGTIARGQEGTTGVAHSSGVAWAHVSTAWDHIFGKSADAPQAGDLGYDYEFLNPGSSLPSGWSWTNQGAAVYTEYIKGGVISQPQTSGDSIACLLRSAPAAPFTITAKIRWAVPAVTGSPTAQLVLSDGTKLVIFGPGLNPSFALAQYAMNSPTSWNATTKLVAYGNRPLIEVMYLRIVYTSSTNMTFSVSPDGLAWETFNTYAGGWLSGLTAIGFGVNGNGQATAMTCEWFRVR